MLWALDGYRALRDHEDETKANENAEDSGGQVSLVVVTIVSDWPPDSQQDQEDRVMEAC